MGLMLYKWLFLSLLSFGRPAAPAPDAHPFYVSVVEVEHNGKDKALEVSCKIFVDDMEDVLKQNFKTSVDLTNSSQETRNGEMMKEYITHHLSFTADGKPAKLNFIGFEKEKESIYCYFESPNLPTLKKLDVNNSLLHDFKQEQINIMHITVNGSRKSYKLDFPNTKASFNF